jgi:BlaI family penicillinase repressor
MAKSPQIPRLSEMEWEVMKPLWKRGPMAARDIYDEIPDTYGWAYKTVKTMLARLVKKGALGYDRVGNSFLYRAAYTQEEMSREATRSFVRRVFDGALSPFVAHFMEEVSPEELKVLKSELARIEKERSSKQEP